jgi:hypothetical protein
MANQVRRLNSGSAPSGPRRISPYREKIRQRAHIKNPEAESTYSQPNVSSRDDWRALVIFAR